MDASPKEVMFLVVCVLKQVFPVLIYVTAHVKLNSHYTVITITLTYFNVKKKKTYKQINKTVYTSPPYCNQTWSHYFFDSLYACEVLEKISHFCPACHKTWFFLKLSHLTKECSIVDHKESHNII